MSAMYELTIHRDDRDWHVGSSQTRRGAREFRRHRAAELHVPKSEIRIKKAKDAE